MIVQKTVFEFLKDERELVKKINDLRPKVADAKRLRLLDEGNAWVTTDFKALGATSEKMRSGVVKQIMNEFPNTYGQQKAELENLETELKFVRDVISTMRVFETEFIEIEVDDKYEE